MPNHEAWRFTWPPCFLTRRHVQKCGGDATPEGDADHATTGKQGRQECRDRARSFANLPLLPYLDRCPYSRCPFNLWGRSPILGSP